MERSNIYDMSMTCQLAGQFYEREGVSKFRHLKSLAGEYTLVTDKKLISKLNGIFKKVTEEEIKSDREEAELLK